MKLKYAALGTLAALAVACGNPKNKANPTFTPTQSALIEQLTESPFSYVIPVESGKFNKFISGYIQANGLNNQTITSEEIGQKIKDLEYSSLILEITPSSPDYLRVETKTQNLAKLPLQKNQSKEIKNELLKDYSSGIGSYIHSSWSTEPKYNSGLATILRDSIPNYTSGCNDLDSIEKFVLGTKFELHPNAEENSLTLNSTNRFNCYRIVDLAPVKLPLEKLLGNPYTIR